MELEVRFFQTPSIQAGGRRVVFALKKAEALLYYLAVEKRATRDVLADLFWGDLDERTARKNLRDALYHLKKLLGDELLILTGRQDVDLNPAAVRLSDLETFLSDAGDGLAAYTGDFLKGFSVREAGGFEEWLLERRECYRALYAARLERRIREADKNNTPSELALLADSLIRVDAFNEESYRILMKSHAERGAYGKAINTYHRLRELLARELGIAPDLQTRSLFQSIVETYNRQEQKAAVLSGGFFYGRRPELGKLAKRFDQFRHTGWCPALLILGDMGVGKTRLKDRFLETVNPDGAYILATGCHPAEQAFALKPLDRVFAQLEAVIRKEGIAIPALWQMLATKWFPGFMPTADGNEASLTPPDGLKHHVSENAVQNILIKVAQAKKVLLVIEDIHWMDAVSLGFLSGVLSADRGRNILLLATAREGYGRDLERFILSQTRQKLLERIDLRRFTREESMEFIGQALGGGEPDGDTKAAICKEAEGVALFLAEYVNVYRQRGSLGDWTATLKDILDTRLIDLADEDRKLLEIAAVFFDEVTADMLQALSGRGGLAVLDSLERLKHKLLLREVEGGGTGAWAFTHQKIREYVYQRQSLTKRRMLHNNTALILENSLTGDERDSSVYPRIIHHFTQAGNAAGAIRYSILHVKRYLDFRDELFPEWPGGRGPLDSIGKQQAGEWLTRVEEGLESLPGEAGETPEVEGLRMVFLYLKGRYLIREGHYETGTALVEDMLAIASRLGNAGYVIQGYKELIYHAIRIHDLGRMAQCIEPALAEARRRQERKEIGVLLRLKGLMKMLNGSLEEAEELLGQALQTFRSIENENPRYALNIAACHCYRGDIFRYRGKYDKALKLYRQAIALAKSAWGTQSLAIFHSGAGQAAYQLGRWEEARDHLEQAIRIYDLLDSGWGRAVAEGYMALLCCRKEEYSRGKQYLSDAEQHAAKSRNPYELGLLHRVKAEIRHDMVNNKAQEQEFSACLPLETEAYCREGLALLNAVWQSQEKEFLQALEKRGACEGGG